MHNIGDDITNMGGGFNYINCDSITHIRKTKNLFNKSLEPIFKNNSSYLELDTGVRSTITVNGTNRYYVIEIPNSDLLLGKTITLSSIINPSSTNDGAVRLFALSDLGIPVVGSLVNLTSTGSASTLLPDEYPSGTTKFGLLFSSNRNSESSSINDYVDYTNVQLELGNTATEYEPYIG